MIGGIGFFCFFIGWASFWFWSNMQKGEDKETLFWKVSVSLAGIALLTWIVGFVMIIFSFAVAISKVAP